VTIRLLLIVRFVILARGCRAKNDGFFACPGADSGIPRARQTPRAGMTTKTALLQKLRHYIVQDSIGRIEHASNSVWALLSTLEAAERWRAYAPFSAFWQPWRSAIQIEVGPAGHT
jgi:hypothetical protein